VDSSGRGSAFSLHPKKVGFIRAVLLLPLTPLRLNQRLLHPNVKLLMKFPDDSVPFITANHWYGGSSSRIGCYKQKHTHMTLLMYESTDFGLLKPVNMYSLHNKLASWFLQITYTGTEPHERGHHFHWGPNRTLLEATTQRFANRMEILETDAPGSARFK